MDLCREVNEMEDSCIEKAQQDAKRLETMQELNCHVDIYPGGIRFSYSGKADELFQKGANVAIDQLWDKLALIFMDDKWRKKWKVRDAKDFFRTYKPENVFDEVM